MKINKWTMSLAALGLVSLASVAQADEKGVPLMTAVSSTSISGYVDASANWTFGTGNGNPAPVASNESDRHDGFNLNAIGIKLEKPLEEGNWSAGYTIDLVAGDDAALLGSGIGDNSLAIKQAYVALRAPVGNGIDFKLGVWDAIYGYEAFEAYKNKNASRSYGWSVEPTTYTGLQASYKFNDSISIAGGIANKVSTADGGLNERSDRAESYKAYTAALTLTAPESFGFLKGSTLTGGFSTGANADDDRQINGYAGLTVPTPLEGLGVGLAYDYVKLEGPGSDGEASLFAVYTSYQATEKFGLHLRGEYGRGALAGVGDGKVIAVTATAQYDLWENVISRVEFRWDHAASGDNFFGDGAAPDAKNDYQLIANVIYKF